MQLLTRFCFTLLLLVFITGCAEKINYKKISTSDYKDKVYASWLAQVIGNIYGLPHENDYIEKPGPETFPYGYGPNIEYLKEINGAFSDDDTDIEYMYLLTMEKHGLEPSYAQLAEAWKYHVRERVWLANRAALGAMHYGYSPPVTGLKDYNPHWFQIDPQLVNEIWAVTAPGMIGYAADKSAWAARITNDDWGIEPTIHYGAMYAAAFFETDIKKLINIGTKALPEGNRFAKTVEDMKVLYQKYPNDWKAARKEMAEKYYHEEPIDTKTIWNAILNGACGILALLYGDGDFQKTLDLACAMGFDADNQAATMSGLLGIILGTQGLPNDLVYPLPDLNWKAPFNDFYKNVSRYDMPDASLKDMAERIATQGEKIILMHGGKKITVDGKEYYLINPKAEFIAPLEFPGAPMPYIEVGDRVDYHFYVSGGNPPFAWTVKSGNLPEGLTFSNGILSGTATKAGIYPIEVQIVQGKQNISQKITLIVRDVNFASTAKKIIASVKETNTNVRDEMWLTVGRSLYAPTVDIINDGKRLGKGSTFYSITGDLKKKIDYYGYEWGETKTIGLLSYHMGSMEESGGWFTSLNVEYRDSIGNWRSVEDLIIFPSLLPNEEPFNKAHFVEYLLAFQPVETSAVRMIGNAGTAKHWYNKPQRFTSITELSVHGPLPNYQTLNSN